MRVLTTSGVFSVVQGSNHAGDAPVYYKLTRVSRLLVERSPHHLRRIADIDPFAWPALLKMAEWFTMPASTLSLFELAHGRAICDTTVNDGGLFIGFMAAVSRVTMNVLLKEYGGVFREVRSSLVHVGGSHGATAGAVARAFPHVKCTVLDLPDVVAGC
ncbi:hypothetical protein ACQ4PT_024009 [Festuca glaucescens]